MHRYRTHTCGALRASDIGKEVRLSGWCQRIRDHGGVLFIDLRDHYGIIQVVADPDSPAFKTAETLRSESVIRIDGKVRQRPAGTENPELPTGAVEVYIREIEVLGPAAELPMPVFGDQEYPEEIRLKYRFLDLRRERLHRNIMTRVAVIDSIRRRMKQQGFFEFQTPILTASSPEGARDYLVPSRPHPGKFYAFRNLIKAGGVVRAIPAPAAATQPRSWFDRLNDWARSDMGAAGLGYIVWEGDDGKGPIAKFVPADVQQKLRAKSGVGPGDCLFFAAGKPAAAAKLAGAARSKIGEELGMIAKDRFEFCWIVDFPMYEWNEEEKRIDFSHNPFSMPNMAPEQFLALDPADHETILSIRAIQYDIVCNGVELSSGAIRNHRPDVMRKAFAIAGYEENVLEHKFGGMMRALSRGAPPHGGIAPGIDRIVMLLCGEDNLREVVLFPMNQRAEDLMMGAPSEVSSKQLRELHIRLALPEK